jgi:AAA domain
MVIPAGFTEPNITGPKSLKNCTASTILNQGVSGQLYSRKYRDNSDILGFTSPLDRKLLATGFNSQRADTKQDVRHSLRALEAIIKAKVSKSKTTAPWVKLARFGNAKTPKGSLRHDANVNSIDGIEGDYDGGQMPMGVAAGILKAANLAALLYESPSSTPENPRWRVVCPCSTSMHPSERAALVARVNGVLGGVLDGVSFNLSQSFYFGNIEGKPPIKTALVDGRYIDNARDLDATAIGRGGKVDSDTGERENDDSRNAVAFREAESLYLSGEPIEAFAEWAIEHPWKDYEADSDHAIKRTWENVIAHCLKHGLVPHPNIMESIEDETHTPEPVTKHSNFTMTPFKWQDPKTVEPVAWLYGEAYARKYVSALGAASGAGKSMLVIGEALAMASNKPILGDRVAGQPLTVSYVNLEDPIENMTGRAIAAMHLHGIEPHEIEGRYFINGSETDLVIAEQTRSGGPKISRPVVDAIEKNIRDNKIDVLIVDPFVSSHRVTENDAGAMDLVAGEWARIAQRMNISVLLVHHVRKAGNDQSGKPREITINDFRGSGATIAKTRVVRLLNTMSQQMARRLGLSDSHKTYVRVDDGKTNIGPPADKAAWRHIVNVDLGRARVGAIEAWVMPAIADGVTVTDITKALEHLERGGTWRTSVQSKEHWTGSGIAKALGMDLTDSDDLIKVKALIKAWTKAGYLTVEQIPDDYRIMRPCHVVTGKPDDVFGDESEGEIDPDNEGE